MDFYSIFWLRIFTLFSGYGFLDFTRISLLILLFTNYILLKTEFNFINIVNKYSYSAGRRSRMCPLDICKQSKWSIIFIYTFDIDIFHRYLWSQRWVTLLNMQLFQNSTESGKRECLNENSVPTLGSQVSFGYPVMCETKSKAKIN